MANLAYGNKKMVKKELVGRLDSMCAGTTLDERCRRHCEEEQATDLCGFEKSMERYVKK